MCSPVTPGWGGSRWRGGGQAASRSFVLCTLYPYLRNPSAGTQETDTKKLLNHNSPVESLGTGGLLLEKGNNTPTVSLYTSVPVSWYCDIPVSFPTHTHTHTHIHRPVCKWNPSQGKHDTLKAKPYLCSPSGPLESTCCLADLSLGICFLCGSCRTQ